MNKKNAKQNFNFTMAAIYKIVVQGELTQEWSDSNLGLQVSVQKINEKESITTLIGKINDQSALSGILLMLNDMHITVISVNMLSEIDES